jgi:hypothetical protein
MAEKEFSVDDLITQLKVNTNNNKDLLNNNFDLPREKLESFVLNSTGKLVTQGLEIVEGVKDYVMNNPESREVEALSEALKAVSSALSIIKDIHVTQMKKDSAKDLKIMEIESRKMLKDDDRKEKLLLSRDEVFKRILDEAKVIEAQAEAVNVTLVPVLSS